MNASGSVARTRLMACHECDALHHVVRGVRGSFRCVRCGAVVHRAAPQKLDSALALTLAAFVFFVLANAFPVVGIEASGNRTYATLIGAALALHQQGIDLVAIVVIATTVVFPLVELVCTCVLLLPTKLRRRPTVIAAMFRIRERVRPWSMVEIFVLGTLVAIVKLGNVASVLPGIGMWSLGAFIAMSAAASRAFDPVEFWDRIEPAT